MGDSDDDIPSLEEMAPVLEKTAAMRIAQNATQVSEEYSKPISDSSRTGASILKSEQSKSETDTLKSEQSKPASKASAGTFGGMKKGFLFSSSPKETQKSNPSASQKTNPDHISSTGDASMPFIKPKSSEEEERQLPEVQEAMKAGQGLLDNKDWVTDSLLEKITKNPDLGKRLTDHRFMQAIAEFQSNPEQAMLKYKDNAEIQSFLKEMCGILGKNTSSGEHFTNMPDTQTKSTTQASTTSSSSDILTRDPHKAPDIRPYDPEQEKVEKLLADPEMREILMDRDIQQLIQMVRTQPDKARHILQMANGELAYKVQKLVDGGLIQMQS